MAFETQVFYGYKINNNLADVIDPDDALQVIGLNIGDLDIIRGASQAGAVREDVIAISDLDRPIYKTLDRFIGDSNEYSEILTKSAGTDKPLFGNLTINGAIGGSAVRYKYLESDEIKFSDISTSRTSAWSTTSGNPAESDPIFYGSQIKIKSGGDISVNQITWGQTAAPREFDAEVPTHKITTTINGETVKLYAMKSIPLKLEGYFRNFNGTVNINQVNNLRVSWKIINQINASDIQRYANQGTSSGHTLRYRSVSGAPRTIEVYYPPDNIRTLVFPGIGLKDLPPASLSGLEVLNISFNQLDQVPNINSFAPNLTDLNIAVNNVYLGANPALRKFGLDTANRLSTTITSLTAYSTFGGSIRCVDRSNKNGSGTIIGSEITIGIGESDSMSVIEARMPNLVTLNLGRTSRRRGLFFGPDNYDSLAYLPSVPDSCQNYDCSYNDFRRVPAVGIKNLTNLRNFNVYDNYNLSDSGTWSIQSNSIETINTGHTILPIPDLNGKTALTTFSYRHNRNTNPLFTNVSSDSTYKFAACTSLRTLDLYNSRVEGFIPKFSGNFALDRVDMYSADNITGGRPDNGAHGYSDGKTFVMYKDTFTDAKDIRFFRVLSRRLLEGKGFEEGTFGNLRNLYYLYWYSYRRTGRGGNVQLPDISGCPSLRYFIMHTNDFTGQVPSMVSNNNIYYIHLARNKLSGAVPQFTNRTNLRFLYLYDNNLTSFPGFNNTPRLQNVYLHNNQLSEAIPNFSGQTPNLRRLYLFNNNFTSYTRGSFREITRIRILDISNNDLSVNDLNNIIDDLYTNYENAPRSRVTINLRGQSNAVGYNPSSIGSSTEQTAREKIDFLLSRGWNINL